MIIEQNSMTVHTEQGDTTTFPLQDTTKNGKVIDWRGRKIETIKIADLYYQLLLREALDCWRKRLDSLSTCSNNLIFNQYDDGTKKLIKADFCKKRLCPMCTWRKTLKNSFQLTQVCTELVRQKSNTKFLFLTLTLKNVSGHELRETLQAMLKGFKRLTENVRFEKVIRGYYRSLEITQTNSDGTFHPHLHVLLAVDDTYFNGGYYLSQKVWSAMWQQAMRLDYVPIVHVERIYSKKEGKNSLQAAISESAKYVTKSSDVLNGSIDSKLHKLKVLTEALHRVRLTSYGGVMKEIHSALNLLDAEDSENLVNVDENNEQQETLVPLYQVIYKWFGDNYYS